EHTAGDLPFWLAPVQVRVIPVSERHAAAAEALRERLPEYRVDVDDRDETVGKRIRDAEVEEVPRVIVYGDRGSDGSAAVRERHGDVVRRTLAELLEDLAKL